MEVELKLLVAPEDLARDRAAPGAHGPCAAGRRGGSTSPPSTTTRPDFALAREGVALRVRRDGERIIQTLKGRKASRRRPARARRARMAARRRRSPDLALLDETPYRRLFARKRVRERLQPVFTTEFDRAARMVAFADGTAAELAIDRGEIRAGEHAAPISEAEIELKSGDRAPPVRAGARDRPRRADPARAREQGGARLRACGGTPRAAAEGPRRRRSRGRSRPAPHCGASRSRASRRCRRTRTACSIGRGSRVSAPVSRRPATAALLSRARRRSRSAKHAVADVAAELRWLQNALGPARDWDVFTTETFATLGRSVAAGTGLKAFRARCARIRRAHGEAAREAVRSARYTALAARARRAVRARRSGRRSP